MVFLKTSHDGELMVDHSASPGLTPEQARKMGYDPQMVGEGAKTHAPTLGCPHCGSHIVLNPFRKRPRAHCYQCDQYICDTCDAVRHEPDYVHRNMNQVRELVASGKWEYRGNMSKGLLIPR
jgi:hypothetical protein